MCSEVINNSPLVSVVIPTYNRSSFIGNAIESVLEQTFTDYEIIVIDDGSEDATRETVAIYGDRIRYFYQQNSGVSTARNAGIAIAKGTWVAFLDSDDEWRRDYLSTQMANVYLVPGLCMQSTNCCFVGLNGEKNTYWEINGCLPKFREQNYLLPDEPFQFIINHAPWQVGSTVFLRESLVKAGLFDTSLTLSEDLDLMARVALQGRFGIIKEELVNIFRRNENTVCLTSQAIIDPVRAREVSESIFEKLKQISTLKQTDLEALNKLLGANRRAIGNYLLEIGDVNNARASYKLAMNFDRSIASIGKYILSFLPKKLAVRLSEKYLAWRRGDRSRFFVD